MRSILYGGAEQEAAGDQTAAIAQELYSNNLLLQLVLDLPKIEFEVCFRHDLPRDFAFYFHAEVKTRRDYLFGCLIVSLHDFKRVNT